MIYLVLLFFSGIAPAVELCDFFTDEEMRNILNVSIPNCFTAENLEEERFQQDSSPPQAGPICGNCRSQLLARASMSSQDMKKIRQQAYFSAMSNEYKKAMTSLMIDMVALRKTFSSPPMSKAGEKCNSQNLQRMIDRRCTGSAKSFLSDSGIHTSLGNELAQILAPSPIQAQGTFVRPQRENSCGISPETIFSLRPLLLTEYITPEVVNSFSQGSATTKEELLLELMNNDEVYSLLKSHPTLKSLTESPSDFYAFFRSLQGISDIHQLKNRFNEKVYSPELTGRLDSQIAQRCETAANKFLEKVCSSAFTDGDISLGNFQSFEKFNNNSEPPTGDLVSTEPSLNRNIALVDFCEERSNTRLNLRSDSEEISRWLISNERSASLQEFGSRVHEEQVETFRSSLCQLNQAGGCSDNSASCRLYRLYDQSQQPNSPLFRLANSPDRNINRVLGSMISDGPGLSPEARQVLIAEGIIPQANGEFVERPEIPERRPDYLSNVANGTITPAGAQTAATTTQPPARPQRTQQPQTTAQPAVFQPQAAANSDVTPDSTRDDIDALRDFEERLGRRLTDAERAAALAEARTQPQRPAPSDRGRRDTRAQDSRTPGPAFTSVPQPQAFSSGSVDPQTVQPPQAGDATLDRDPNRRTLADAQRNAALAAMDAKNRPQGGGVSGAQRGPASTGDDTQGSTSPDSTVALTISGDIRQNLEQVITGSDASGANLRALLRSQAPFRFQLNNSLFDVQFINNAYVVTFRSGNDPRGSQMALTLQNVFNNSARRSGGGLVQLREELRK